MIGNIEIKNFRSIQFASLDLTPLTIIIGANGSGKSNLTKAIEFLSAIPDCGFGVAISRFGGRNGLMPKSIPLKDIGKKEVSFKYTVRLPPPAHNRIIKYVDVKHDFSFTFKGNERIAVNSEKIEFHQVLFVGEVLRHKKRGPKIAKAAPSHPSSASTFSLSHDGGKDTYAANPPISEENFDTYLSWLGLEGFSSKIKTPNDLFEFFEFSENNSSKENFSILGVGKKSNRGLYIDRRTETICDWSSQYRTFLDLLQDTRTYDLLLNELRNEQSPSDVLMLSKSGGNLPGALSKLIANKKSFSRLSATFSIVAPHILKMYSSQLRTGKEFVEFKESRNGRGIESWEASDGSLRALAILVAVETATKGQTIIVEEPEQNLHPWAVRALVDHIRSVIEEKDIQVILTTHSEHVLDRATPEEVIVASRHPENGTTYKKVREIAPKLPVEMGEIGRLWIKGMLGGVPTMELNYD